MGIFLINSKPNGEYYFNLKADSGQIILSFEGFANRTDCKNGIDSVRKSASDDNMYERKTSANGKYYFNLKNAEGIIIGTSEIYQTFIGRDRGIDYVKMNAPNALVEDE